MLHPHIERQQHFWHPAPLALPANAQGLGTRTPGQCPGQVSSNMEPRYENKTTRCPSCERKLENRKLTTLTHSGRRKLRPYLATCSANSCSDTGRDMSGLQHFGLAVQDRVSGQGQELQYRIELGGTRGAFFSFNNAGMPETEPCFLRVPASR